LALAPVRDLRDHRAPVSEEDLADFETGVLAGFVLARASAGLAGSTIRNDTGRLQLIRDWFGRRHLLWPGARHPHLNSGRCPKSEYHAGGSGSITVMLIVMIIVWQAR
jgi:hypothetical protein